MTRAAKELLPAMNPAPRLAPAGSRCEEHALNSPDAAAGAEAGGSLSGARVLCYHAPPPAGGGSGEPVEATVEVRFVCPEAFATDAPESPVLPLEWRAPATPGGTTASAALVAGLHVESMDVNDWRASSEDPWGVFTEVAVARRICSRDADPLPLHLTLIFVPVVREATGAGA